MPEGAEVKLFGESLARIVAGKTLSNIKVLSGRYLKKEIEDRKKIELAHRNQIESLRVELESYQNKSTIAMKHIVEYIDSQKI